MIVDIYFLDYWSINCLRLHNFVAAHIWYCTPIIIPTITSLIVRVVHLSWSFGWSAFRRKKNYYPSEGGTKLELLRRDGRSCLDGYLFFDTVGESNKFYLPLIFPLSFNSKSPSPLTCIFSLPFALFLSYVIRTTSRGTELGTSLSEWLFFPLGI